MAGYELKHAQSLLHVRMEEELTSLGLTVSQYSALFRLQQEPGISASDLARRTFVTRQSMNALLQQLVDRGLVSRGQGTGRALPTELTRAGRDALAAAQVRVDAVDLRMLARLTPAEQRALETALEACIAALADDGVGE